MRARGCSRLGVVLAILGGATITLSLAGHPAAADPPLPEAAEPAGTVVSPIADEVPPCGHLSLGLIAADVAVQAVSTAVGPVLPATITELIARAYGEAFLALFGLDGAACDAIPTRQFDTTCDVDDQVGSAIASVPFPGLPVDVVGLAPVPTDPALAGALVDVIAAIEREASRAPGASAAVAGPLGCETVERVAPSPVPGGVGGGVDLTPPATKDSPTGPNREVVADTKAAPPRVPARHGGASEAAASANTPAHAATPPDATEAADAVPAVAGSGDDNTRRNVYAILFLLTAAAAALGWAPPRRTRGDTP